MRAKKSWNAKGKRHDISVVMKLKASESVQHNKGTDSDPRCSQVIQHDIANPPILTIIKITPVFPRFAVLLVSDAHTGAVAVFIPLPMPEMTL